MTRGRFVTFEGGEGAGKSTQVVRIANWLRGRGLDIVTTREPGGTPLAEQIRELLLTPREEAVHEWTELLLVFAARAQHLHTHIVPALERGQWVLSDRFTDASYAYQGEGRKMGAPAIATLEQLVQGNLRPDMTLVLDLTIEQSAKRVAGRGKTKDRFEGEQKSYPPPLQQYHLLYGYIEVAFAPDPHYLVHF